MARRREESRDPTRIPTWIIVCLFAGGVITNIAAFGIFIGLR